MDSERLDIWLKLVCLFKQRSDAAEACRGGHVKLNGQRAKPAATVRINDTIEMTVPAYRKVIVLGIPPGNVAKAVARTLYRDETPERPRADFVDVVGHREAGSGRPTKRERRDLEKWRK